MTTTVAPLLKYAGESDEHFGISLVTLDNILKLKKTKPWKGDKETLKRISSDLVPLYKLLASFNSSKSLPENVFDNLKSELNPRKGMFSRTRTRPGVTEQLPKSIMRLLEYNDNLSDINYEGLFEADRITLFVDTEN